MKLQHPEVRMKSSYRLKGHTLCGASYTGRGGRQGSDALAYSRLDYTMKAGMENSPFGHGSSLQDFRRDVMVIQMLDQGRWHWAGGF